MKINPKLFEEAEQATIPDTTPKELWKTKQSAERFLKRIDRMKENEHEAD